MPGPGKPFPKDHPWRFQKGQPSANPGGRSSAAAEMGRMIREETGDGLLLRSYAIAVLLGAGKMEVPVGLKLPAGTPETIDVPDDPKSRAYVHGWLSERGWGKVKQILELTPGQPESGQPATPPLADLLLALDERDRNDLERILTNFERARAEGRLALPMPTEPDAGGETPH